MPCEGVGCGMVNPHSTCFMNASFQALFKLPLVATFLEGWRRSGGDPGPFTARLLRLHAEMQSSRGPVLAKEFCEPQVASEICTGYHPWKMEDVQEWLMGLLGKVQEEVVEAGGGEVEGPLRGIFGGLLQNKIVNRREGVDRRVVEPFASLEVELGLAKSIEDALAEYTRGERLEGANKYRLEYGPSKGDFRMVDAVKRITISKAPNVLMVALKRFPLPDLKISRRIKLSRSLDMEPYMAEGSESKRYDLTAVIVHSGDSTESGHYFTYAKTSNGLWHMFNDEYVYPVPESEVLNSEAYVLFYTCPQPQTEGAASGPSEPARPKSGVHTPEPHEEATNDDNGQDFTPKKKQSSIEGHQLQCQTGGRKRTACHLEEEMFSTPVTKRSRVLLSNASSGSRGTVYATPVPTRQRFWSMDLPFGGHDTPTSLFKTPSPRGAKSDFKPQRKNVLDVAKSILNSAFGSDRCQCKRGCPAENKHSRKKQRTTKFPTCRLEHKSKFDSNHFN